MIRSDQILPVEIKKIRSDQILLVEIKEIRSDQILLVEIKMIRSAQILPVKIRKIRSDQILPIEIKKIRSDHNLQGAPGVNAEKEMLTSSGREVQSSRGRIFFADVAQFLSNQNRIKTSRFGLM